MHSLIIIIYFPFAIGYPQIELSHKIVLLNGMGDEMYSQNTNGFYWLALAYLCILRKALQNEEPGNTVQALKCFFRGF